MKLLFGADIVPTETSEQLFIEQRVEELFGDVAELIKNADRTIVNLECALTKSNNAIKKFGPNLKADEKCADALKKLGVTDVALSNNHTFDFGIEGLKDTTDALDRVGLPYMGIGENDTESRKPYFIEQDGKTIGIINVCEHEFSYALPDRIGANPFDPFLTMQDIRAVRKESDYVVVIYHGGKEHVRYPSPRLRNLCREMVLCGADVVLTQHSHCIGCYEEYEGGHILYGQGNFHFTKANMKDTWYTGLLVEINITDKLAIKFIPLTFGDTTIDVAKGEKAKEIMTAFEARNEELKNGAWTKGWHDFCESMREVYDGVLRGLCEADTTEEKQQLFAHFLDCEAHTDVWRELNPTYNMTNEK